MLPLLLSLSVSCSHSFALKTEPAGAKVFWLSEKGERGQLIGESPLELGQLKGVGDKEYYSLEITKEGYDTRLFFAPILSGSSQEFVVKLRQADNAYFTEQFKKERSAVINASFGSLLLLQEAVLAKNAPRVNALAAELEKEFDQVSWFHSLLGNFHYLSGNRPEALKRYQRAAELDPTNSEAVSMLRMLRLQPQGRQR